LKSIVLYTTKTGNTEKVAKAISNAFKVDCINITSENDLSKSNLNEYDLFFIGTGVYGGKPQKNLIQFLEQFKFSSQKIFAVFLTWLGRGKSDNDAFKVIKNILSNKNQIVYENYYKCYGKTLFIRHNHPDRKDFEGVIQWTNSVLQNL
jgi:flavodoxin